MVLVIFYKNVVFFSIMVKDFRHFVKIILSGFAVLFLGAVVQVTELLMLLVSFTC